MIKNKELKRRIIDLSYKHKLSHLSSVLTAVDIIKEIYDQKKPEDKFVLSSGHAGLALYVALESKDMGINAEWLLESCGIHPDKVQFDQWMGNAKTPFSIDCSTGSLGQGLPIAVGMALADRNRTVYVLISDGESFEGIIYESLNFIRESNIKNIRVYVNINGYTAYKVVNTHDVAGRLKYLYPDIIIRYTDLDGLPSLQDLEIEGHYKVLNEQEYKEVMEVLK